MGYPDALIYEIGAKGIAKIDYEETDHFRVTRDFLNKRERMLRHLFADEPEGL